MSKKRSKPQYTAEEALELLEKDEESTVCVHDSSSEEEDLLCPESQDDSDSCYCPPASENWGLTDEDEDERDDGGHKPSHANITGPSTTTHQRRTSPRFSNPPQVTAQSGPSAPSATARQNRRCSSVGTSTRNPVKRKLKSPKKEAGDWWFTKEETDIKPDCYRFMPARTPGPTFDTTEPWSPISLFQLFFSTSVVAKIIENTNLNADRKKSAGSKFKWQELTVKDFYTFLAIILFTGLVRVHHRSDYWSNEWPYSFPFPSKKMTHNRFDAILWSLHLSNPEDDAKNEKKKKTAGYDRLFKIKPLYTEMVNACRSHFHPYKNLSIDQRTVASKPSMKLYDDKEPTKRGYKLHVLADSSTGYTWNFSVYTSKTESAAVMDLLPFSSLGSGYTLYAGTFYTSPTLFNNLSQKNFGCCGIIRRQHMDFPQTNKPPSRAERGDIRWTRSGKLLCVKWMDTREVTMCSTVHQAYSGRTVKRNVKVDDEVWKKQSIPVPDCVLDYRQNMGSSHALFGFYSVCYETRKWYKTFFYHFVDIAVVNSWLLHKELFKVRKDPNQAKPLTHKAFREQLVKEMLEFAESTGDIPPLSFPDTCMPVFYEHEETRRIIRKYCRRCRMAGMPRVKTSVHCRKCLVPLCLTSKKNCFQMWHDGE